MELGLHHEQQHQELILSDIKHVFFTNPLRPAYDTSTHATSVARTAHEVRWHAFAEELRVIGAAGQDAFAYDNESPAHRQFLRAFSIQSRLVTNGEYRCFMEDGGYRNPLLWLSDGWRRVQDAGWSAPLYWELTGSGWTEFTLRGVQPLDPEAPVMHVSFYEAEAFARWAGARLPLEAEWEVAAESLRFDGSFLESAHWHPIPATADSNQFFGEVWQFTSSPYVAYPGYTPVAGAVGEYNGKFMCDQWVLRGASFATPRSHVRRTYRNFYPADARWQFGGVRLAKWA